MDEVRFFPASALSPSALADAFNAAFEGYFVPMRHTDDSLATMVRANDIHLADSLIAETASGDLLGVGLLGVRGSRGWIGGMAIAPEHRGHGSGALLLTALLDRARELGLSAVQLEVLDQNVSARRLYTRLGFNETRPLIVYTGVSVFPTAHVSAPHISELPAAVALAQFEQLHAVTSPWQREDASLQHMAPTLSGLSIHDEQGLRSYLLAMPSGGGYALLDFGSRPSDGAEAQADALALLAHLTANDPTITLRAINIPPGDALGDALTTLGCTVVATQREMRLALR